MYNDIAKPPPPLPTPSLKQFGDGISLLPPLSRRGHGPGLVILIPDTTDELAIREGVPSLLVKWAEEGYVVVSVQERALSMDISTILTTIVEALSECEKCSPKGKLGVVSYVPKVWDHIGPALSEIPEVVAAVVYANVSEEPALATTTVLQHLAGSAGDSSSQNRSSATLKTYYYSKAATHEFAIPFQHAFHYGTEALSHTRNLEFLKPLMGGPYFDLETIWDEHTYYEFADRSVEHTMSTMVQEPYVNHVPTVTGGVGRKALTDFYRHNFIFNNSADTELELLSRTLGIDRVVDEFLFKFTHDKVLDWLLPGVPPTFKKAEVPFMAVVNIRGDRLYHEHITWDQGTILVQLGLMPEYLPFPYPLPTGTTRATPGKSIEYRVPVVGIETALKMGDRNSVPSNGLFEYDIREV